MGTEVVQAAEILPTVHQTLDSYLAKVADEFSQMPPEFQAEQRKKWHREVVLKTLDDVIKVKLLLTEVRSVVPEEALKKNTERIRKEFNENEIKRMMALYKVASIAELENKLREQGGSLDAQRNLFVDRFMAISWLRQQVKDQKEPTHEELASYYRDHAIEWERPARARWEQLTARFDAFESKAAAWRTLATWGKEVQRGVPWAQVAKARSTAFSAEEGGINDWTTKGSLRSTALDTALFGLPVGALSQIIEDEEGFHIVRVVEREEQHHVPFGELQDEIKQRLQSNDQAKGMNEYLAKLRDRTPVTDMLNGDNSTIAAKPAAPPR